MVKLGEMGDKTANLIYDWYVKASSDWRRPHLGASQIGHHCSRKLWYGFRWSMKTITEGRMLRLFKRGDIEEDWVADDLRAIGVALDTDDPETNKQWRFAWHGGHFGGSCDGIGKGFPGAEKALHVFECKTANTKWFKTIKRDGVRKAKAEHYGQMQSYMLGFRERGIAVNRAFYVVVCKETDEIWTERVRYDEVEAKAMVAKARVIVEAPEPLTKISNDPSWHQCQWCDYKSICHLERVEDLERNCRTCLSSTPLDDGTWFCEHWQKTLTMDRQRGGCEKHLFIPSLLPWEAVDADTEGRAVYYKDRKGIRFVDSAMRLTLEGERQ